MTEILIQNHDYNEMNSYDTIDLNNMGKGIKYHIEEASMIKHVEGYIWAKQYRNNSSISKFYLVLYFLSGVVSYFFIALCLQFDRKLSSIFLKIASITPMIFNFILYLDSTVLIYYRRYSFILYLFNTLNITWWVSTFYLLKYEENRPNWVIISCYFHYIIYPLILSTLFILHHITRKIDAKEIVHFFEFEFIIHLLVKGAIILKVFKLGLGPVRWIFIFLPVTAICIIGIIAGIVFLWDFFKNYPRNMEGRMENMTRSFLSMALIGVPMCSYGLFILYKLDDFFEGKTGRFVTIINYLNIWVVLIFMTSFLFDVIKR